MSGEMIKKKSYDLAFKLKAIENAEVEGNHAVANRLNIDRKRIIEWRKQKDELTRLLNDGRWR